MNSSGALPLNRQPVPATSNHTPADTSATSSAELPANLVDLTVRRDAGTHGVCPWRSQSEAPRLYSQVSELRQQLRKRGLPVSGTKPALLQRLRTFTPPPTCLTPACQMRGQTETLTPRHTLAANQSPSSSSSSGADSPSSSPNPQMYVQDRGIPNGILSGVPSGIAHAVPKGLSNAVSGSLSGEQCGLTNAVFLAPASTASGTPSPGLPMSSSSPLQCGNPWRTDSELQQQELSVELEMRERMRSRPRDCSANAGREVRNTPACPFHFSFLNSNVYLRFFIFLCNKTKQQVYMYINPIQNTNVTSSISNRPKSPRNKKNKQRKEIKDISNNNNNI